MSPRSFKARGTVVGVEHNVLMKGEAWEKEPTTGIETRKEFEEVGTQVEVNLDRGPATALVKPRHLQGPIDEASEVEVTAVEEPPEVVVVED